MNIRPAEATDIRAISRIIVHHAAQGVMLPRSESSIRAGLSNYLVVERHEGIVACGALHRYTADLGEIIGLATAPGHSGNGAGSAIVDALVDRAETQGLDRVFAMTLAPEFFERLGFVRIAHSDVPPKIWKDCVTCGKFGRCNEIAMVRRVS